MIWFLEREADCLSFEIRRSVDSDHFEIELARHGSRPETHTFASATDLIDHHLLQQASLRAQGWSPRLPVETTIDLN